MKNMKLENKNILITGASSGIGEALAGKLAKSNNLILVARNYEKLKLIKEQNETGKYKIFPVQCDVSKKTEVEEAYVKIKKKFTAVDVAILNSGVSYRMKVEKFNSGLAEEIFGTNVMGIIYWVEQLIKDFVRERKGTIVGVSSLAGNRGYSGSSFYSASKAAVSIYLEGLRNELKKYNVKVLTVKPGFVKTPMTDKNKFPMPFIISPEKAAGYIIRGIEKGKKIIAFPLPMVLIVKFIGALPVSVYDFLASKNKYE